MENRDLLFPLQSVFVALPLENEAKREFQRLQDGLREFEDMLSFQKPESPHLTLQFWRSLMKIEYDQVLAQLEAVSSKADSFDLKVEGVGTFGKTGDEHVVFLDVPFSEPLARLKKSCPWPSGQEFRPHITLARIRHPQKFHVRKKEIMKRLSGASFTMRVDLVRLYADIGGVKQTPLADFPFSPRP